MGKRTALSLAASAVLVALSSAARQKPEQPTIEELSGRVVPLSVYLQRRYGIAIDREQGDSQVVLEMEDGGAVPLLRDDRSRFFFMDRRVQDRPVVLKVYRYKAMPYVRLLDAWTVKQGKRFRICYWCNTCAITTFTPGRCPCCQDDVELQEVPVEGER